MLTLETLSFSLLQIDTYNNFFALHVLTIVLLSWTWAKSELDLSRPS
jgi:hypothetical protein